MNFLLDTSPCISLFSGDSSPVLPKLVERQRAGSAFYVPSIVLFELWYGVAKSKRVLENSGRFERLLNLGILPLDFNGADAESAGHIRAALESNKESIGSYDTLIAGQALARGLTLVTSNQREFSRVEDLVWEDWS